MYFGHGCLCVWLCTCLSVPCRIPTLLNGPGCNAENGSGCPVVVHYLADLQSVHRFRCYDNIHICNFISLYTANVYSVQREMSASAYTRCMAAWILAALERLDYTSIQEMIHTYHCK